MPLICDGACQIWLFSTKKSPLTAVLPEVNGDLLTTNVDAQHHDIDASAQMAVLRSKGTLRLPKQTN